MSQLQELMPTMATQIRNMLKAGQDEEVVFRHLLDTVRPSPRDAALIKELIEEVAKELSGGNK